MTAPPINRIKQPGINPYELYNMYHHSLLATAQRIDNTPIATSIHPERKKSFRDELNKAVERLEKGKGNR